MRFEGNEVAEEKGVRVTHLANERLDQPVVGVKAAREDDRQELHRNLAIVRARRGTGPK